MASGATGRPRSGDRPTIHEDPLTTPAEAVDRPDEQAAQRPGRPESLVHGLVRLARPRQWIKNVLVFVAPGAAGIVSLAVLGAIGAQLGGAPRWRGAVRVACGGGIAMIATALIGRLLGVVTG